MKFLRRPPGAAVSVFPQVLDHQAHVLEVSNASLKMPEPEALRKIPNELTRAFDQSRWRRSGWRQFIQFAGAAAMLIPY